MCKQWLNVQEKVLHWQKLECEPDYWSRSHSQWGQGTGQGVSVQSPLSWSIFHKQLWFLCMKIKYISVQLWHVAMTVAIFRNDGMPYRTAEGYFKPYLNSIGSLVYDYPLLQHQCKIKQEDKYQTHVTTMLQVSKCSFVELNKCNL